jgi:chromosome partitioning protein
MEIISLINKKGGVGKTATAVNLAYELSLLGKSVLLIDYDGQANATKYLGMENPVVSVADVMFKSVSPGNAIVETKYENLEVLPSSEEFDRAAAMLRQEEIIPPQLFLRRAIKKHGFPKEYDIVLIDCPPQLDVLTANALNVADYIVVPVQADFFSLDGLEAVLDAVDSANAGRMDSDLELLGVVMTRVFEKSVMARKIFETLKEWDIPIFETRIRSSQDIPKSSEKQVPVGVYNRKSNAALDYRELAQELISLLREAK